MFIHLSTEVCLCDYSFWNLFEPWHEYFQYGETSDYNSTISTAKGGLCDKSPSFFLSSWNLGGTFHIAREWDKSLSSELIEYERQLSRLVNKRLLENNIANETSK